MNITVTTFCTPLIRLDLSIKVVVAWYVDTMAGRLDTEPTYEFQEFRYSTPVGGIATMDQCIAGRYLDRIVLVMGI
jgi:hypothetical protein